MPGSRMVWLLIVAATLESGCAARSQVVVQQDDTCPGCNQAAEVVDHEGCAFVGRWDAGETLIGETYTHHWRVPESVKGARLESSCSCLSSLAEAGDLRVAYKPIGAPGADRQFVRAVKDGICVAKLEITSSKDHPLATSANVLELKGAANTQHLSFTVKLAGNDVLKAKATNGVSVMGTQKRGRTWKVELKCDRGTLISTKGGVVTLQAGRQQRMIPVIVS